MEEIERKYKPIEKGTVQAKGGENPWNYSEKDWQQMLKDIPDFSGEVDKSSQLLSSIARGIKAAKDKFYQKGLTAYKPPMLVIAYGERAKRMSAMHNTDEHTDAVLIGEEFLGNLSRLEFYKIGYLSRADGEIFFHGYLLDMVYPIVKTVNRSS